MIVAVRVPALRYRAEVAKSVAHPTVDDDSHSMLKPQISKSLRTRTRTVDGRYRPHKSMEVVTVSKRAVRVC